jgi:aryl-alcohol dehydrogenase-like predicted oxidoreductase
MQQATLGQTGLRVSTIAFGTWQLGGDWGATDESAAIAAISRAAEQGVTIFDTAQGYGFGASERLLARALHGRNRAELVIATKGGLRPLPTGGITRDASPAWIRAGVEASLTALDTDYIDLYQLHWPDPATPLQATAEELAKLRADGRIRHVGVSNFDAAQLEDFSATLPVETLQPPYHLFRRDIETSVLPYTAAHDIGVLVYGPLAHGLLGGHLRPGATFPTGTGVPIAVSSPASRSPGTSRPLPSWKSWPARTSALRSAGSPWPGRWPTPRCTSPSSAPATPVTSMTRSPPPTCTWTTRCAAGSMPSCGRPHRSPAHPPRASEEHAMTDMRLNGSPAPAPAHQAAPHPRVAVLGTGTMGSAMTRNLLQAGLAVDVWNRTPDSVTPLADAGATAHPRARQAVSAARHGLGQDANGFLRLTAAAGRMLSASGTRRSL